MDVVLLIEAVGCIACITLGVCFLTAMAFVIAVSLQVKNYESGEDDDYKEK